MLTPRQKLTLEHLDQAGHKTVMQKLEYCVKKLNSPRWGTKTRQNGTPPKHCRRRSIKYYQEIINHLAQADH